MTTSCALNNTQSQMYIAPNFQTGMFPKNKNENLVANVWEDNIISQQVVAHPKLIKTRGPDDLILRGERTEGNGKIC